MALDKAQEPVAVIGLGCRFPGQIESPEDFWNLLVSGRDPIGPVPPDRWSLAAYSAADRGLPGRSVSREGGFISGVELFDPQAFQISPSEAPFLDPQHRLMLMVVREALGRAGLAEKDLAGRRVGVFIGAFTHDYQNLQLSDLKKLGVYSSTGMTGTMLSNRVSHAFDFRGPSMTVDTACSSSLLALHLASSSLRRGECDLAVAGGSQIMLSPGFTVAESRTGFLSPTNRCRSFSAEADGYVRSEGVGAAILRLESAAERDRAPIWARLLGSAVNQDGQTPTITQPSGRAQEEVIGLACRAAGLAPGRLDMVEAHGTGTPVGDPIEARAIGAACGPGRDRPLILGAVKSALGHAEAAAGLAGLIKTVLCLNHRSVPANRHCPAPNPAVDFQGLGLELPVTDTPLPGQGRLLAGLNSFGFGGTNVHAVLASPERPPALGGHRPVWNLAPFWVEPPRSRRLRQRPNDGALLGCRPVLEIDDWRSEFSLDEVPWLAGHQVMDRPMFPAAAYAEIILAAAGAAFGSTDFCLDNLTLKRALPLERGRLIELETRLDRRRLEVEVLRADGAAPGERVLARAGLRPCPPGLSPLAAELEKPVLGAEVTQDDLYQGFKSQGFDYQGVFRTLTWARPGPDTAVCRLEAPPTPPGLLFHPAALDCVFQSLLAIGLDQETERTFMIPEGLDELFISGPLTGPLICRAALTETGAGRRQGQVEVLNLQGRAVARIRGFRLCAPRTAPAPAPPLRLAWPEFEISGPAERAHWLVIGGAGDDQEGLRQALAAAAGGAEIYPRAEARAGRLPSKADRLAVFWPSGGGPDQADEHLASLAALFQTLNARANPPRLWLITRGAQAARPGERVDPAAAAAWGLARIIGQEENRALWGGLVDIDDQVTAADLARALISSGDEDQLALRGPQARRLRLAAIQPEDRAPRPKFNPRGTYIITGALGALGRLTTEWAVRRGAARLLLLGRRRELSPEEQNFLAKLADLGAAADYAPVDPSNRAELFPFIKNHRANSEFRGLIHCAAHSEDQLCPDITPAALKRVMAAKAGAAWNLHLALRGQPLEHFVLFSSLGALAGLPSMAAYGAANAFLDGLALSRRARGLPGLSLGWGPWALGLASRNKLTNELFTLYGLPPLTPEAGFQALDQLFCAPEPCPLVFRADWAALAQSPYGRLPVMRDLIEAPGPAPVDLGDEEILPALQNILAPLLDNQTPGPETPLAETGLDSLSSLMAVQAIYSQFGLEINPNFAAEGRTVRELAELIGFRLNGRARAGEK